MSYFLRLYTSPKRRAGRRAYILGLVVPFFIAGLAVGFVARAIPDLAQLFILLSFLLMLWPQIVVNIKRLHDIGRSGWWLLGWCGVAFAISLLPIPHAALFAQLLSYAGVLLLMTIPGSSAPNQYGVKP